MDSFLEMIQGEGKRVLDAWGKDVLAMGPQEVQEELCPRIRLLGGPCLSAYAMSEEEIRLTQPHPLPTSLLYNNVIEGQVTQHNLVQETITIHIRGLWNHVFRAARSVLSVFTVLAEGPPTLREEQLAWGEVEGPS